MDKSLSHSALLGEYFFSNLKIGKKNLVFCLYVLCIIIGIGGFHVWFSLDKSDGIIISTILGYALPIVAAGAADLIFIENDQIGKVLSLIGILVIAGGIVAFFTCDKLIPFWGYFLSILISVIGIFVWFVANASDSKFKDKSFIEKQSEESEKLDHALDESYGK